MRAINNRFTWVWLTKSCCQRIKIKSSVEAKNMVLSLLTETTSCDVVLTQNDLRINHAIHFNPMSSIDALEANDPVLPVLRTTGSNIKIHCSRMQFCVLWGLHKYRMISNFVLYKGYSPVFLMNQNWKVGKN